MILSRRIRLLPLVVSVTFIVSACGGGGSSTTSSAADQIQTPDDQDAGMPNDGANLQENNGNESGDASQSDTFSEGLLTGNYSLTATPNSSQSNPLVDCAVTPGAVSVYNGIVTGFVDGYLDVSGTVSTTGQLTGSANINFDGGSGTWNQPGLCAGNWQMQRVTGNDQPTGQALRLTSEQFPAVLRLRFTPKTNFSDDEVECTRSEGIASTNGLIGSLDKEIDYRGYTETSTGYRWNNGCRVSLI